MPLTFPIQSRKIKTHEEVEEAVRSIATKIGRRLAKENPVILCIMNGGLIFCSDMVKEFNFPMQLDYIHATRYQGATIGKELVWLAEPKIDLHERTVLLVDDIFDEGITLKEVHEYCENKGAKQVYSAVLIKKSKSRDIDYAPDFFAMTAADNYLFGMGMDYQDYWRNTKAIYAINIDDINEDNESKL